MDFTPWIPDSGLMTLSVELGIPDSNRKWDSGFLELYSEF